MSQHFLTDIKIKQFKCFTDFTASGFKRVNLISGKNNIGKTAFMEACFINVHSKNIDNLITALIIVKARREKPNLVNIEINSDVFLEATNFYQSTSNLNNVKFKIREGDAKRDYLFSIREETVAISEKNLTILMRIVKNILYIDSFGWSDSRLSSAYQKIQKADKEEELNLFIQEFDNSIEKIKVFGEKPQCKVKDEYRDISEFGDGLKHYISIICALYACENGYLFIDEIDNGIHYTQLDRLWEIILTTSAKTNCQVFATTHSKEMLESFARVSKQLNEQDISFTTLIKNDKQEIKALTRDYEMILDSLDDGREVR
jgi:AAA15 family ATPase/GTPase